MLRQDGADKITNRERYCLQTARTKVAFASGLVDEVTKKDSNKIYEMLNKFQCPSTRNGVREKEIRVSGCLLAL